jgi:hypothetical protein
LWATDLVSRRKVSLAHAGIQTVYHQAHSIVTTLTTAPKAFNTVQVEKVMGDGQS